MANDLEQRARELLAAELERNGYGETLYAVRNGWKLPGLPDCALRTLDAAPSEPSADDLIERLRALSRCEHSGYTIGDEAADELARLRAEVVELDAGWRDAMKLLNEQTQRAERAERERDELRAEVEGLRESLHYTNGTCDLAMKHRDEAEARIADAPTTRAVAAPGECWIECDVPSDWAGSDVALVRLDAEEGK